MLGAHCKESRTRDREAKMAVGAAEVREAKGLVTLVENVRSAMEQMWTVKGRSESRLGLSPPLSLLLSLTLSGYQTQSEYFPGDSSLPSLPPSLMHTHFYTAGIWLKYTWSSITR